MSDIPKPETVLEEAQRLVYGDRNASYGSPLSDFTCSAQMVSAYLSKKYKIKIELEPQDMPAIMICVKLARQANREKRDNIVDLAGYAATLQWTIDDLNAPKI